MPGRDAVADGADWLGHDGRLTTGARPGLGTAAANGCAADGGVAAVVLVSLPQLRLGLGWGHYG
jgi:hypothetical protein